MPQGVHGGVKNKKPENLSTLRLFQIDLHPRTADWTMTLSPRPRRSRCCRPLPNRATRTGKSASCLFLVAVRASRVFRLGGHGLQQHEVLAAGLAYIFVEWHFKIPFQSTITTLPGPETVQHNTHGAKPCQGKNREHEAHKTREIEESRVDEQAQQHASEHEEAGQEPDEPFEIPCFGACDVHCHLR